MRTGFWCGYVRESTNWEKLGTDEILKKNMMEWFRLDSSGAVRGEVAGCC